MKKSKKNLVFQIIVLLGILATMISCHKNSSQIGNNIFKLAFSGEKSAAGYDPSKINFIYEHTFLKNIFSPLVELDSNGNLISGVAEKYYWKDKELHFELRKDLKTIDGTPITGRDVELSLKRLMILSTNPHGNLKSILCPSIAIKTLDDPCPGIISFEHKIILRPENKYVFLLPMLTSVDFSIIPQKSLDFKTLKIKDYRNTTGVYYVYGEIDGYKEIKLKANPYHYHYSPKILQNVSLVSAGKTALKNSLQLFNENLVDGISTADLLSAEAQINLASVNNQAQLHKTLGMAVWFVMFTQKGIKRISEENRFILAKKIKNIFLEKLSGLKAYNPINQYFLSLGEGAISGEQEKELVEKINTAKDSLTNIKAIKGEYFMLSDLKEKVLDSIATLDSRMQFSIGTLFPNLENDYESMPDFYLTGIDSSFDEDIGLVSFAMNMDCFGLGKEKGKKWLDEYVQIENKQERIEKLRELHYSALIKGYFFPLMSSSFAAIIRKGWSFDFSKTQVSLPLWKIQKEN